MKLTENFSLNEIVDKTTIDMRGDAAAQLIDHRIVEVVQWLRDKTGEAVTINNWASGGKFHESGLRDFNSSTGAKFSQHKYGRALDLKFEKTSPEKIRQLIRNNWTYLKELGLTTIEKDTPTWVHIDCRYTGLDYLLEVPFK